MNFNADIGCLLGSLKPSGILKKYKNTCFQSATEKRHLKYFLHLVAQKIENPEKAVSG